MSNYNTNVRNRFPAALDTNAGSVPLVMQTFWLILGSFALPLVWGWTANCLLAWLWPEKQPLAVARERDIHRPDAMADYQI